MSLYTSAMNCKYHYMTLIGKDNAHGSNMNQYKK